MELKQGTFLDDVITTLRIESEINGKVNISQEVLKEFFAQTSLPESKLLFQQAEQQLHSQKEISSHISSDLGGSGTISQTVNFSEMNLKELENFTLQCRKCALCQRRNKVVFGQGSQDADLMFIGEGPGRDEDIQGIPFVGEAGQLLTKMINAMQFSRSDVYISNIVKCRPPNNRNPEEDEAVKCIPILKRQIELIKPQVIVLLGAVPLKYMLGKTGITRLRGHWFSYNGIKVMPTFHPAYLLRSPAAKKDVWVDLQKVMHIFNKTYKPA
jgi:DNA polymerase